MAGEKGPRLRTAQTTAPSPTPHPPPFARRMCGPWWQTRPRARVARRQRVTTSARAERGHGGRRSRLGARARHHARDRRGGGRRGGRRPARRAALWDAAFRDRNEFAAADLLDPDFAQELVHPLRNVMTRSVWLEVLLLFVDGDFAALLQRVRMRGTVMGEDRSGDWVLSDLWRRVGGEWRVWRRHATPLTPARERRDG